MLVYKMKTIPSIAIGNRTITKIYKGQKLLYRLGFDPITFTENTIWTVPPGVKKILVDCVAGQGFSNAAARGGLGGRVQCILNVAPRQTLKIKIGNQNTVFNVSDNASAIYTGDTWTSGYQVIAGGGGGACYTNYLAVRSFVGGAGGGLTGGTGGNFAGAANNRADIGIGGLGGSQTAGGARGYFSMYLKSLYATAGSQFTGGAPNVERSLSGAGGQGYYGGGGAVEGYYYKGSSEYGASCAAAGGGSSYTHPELCSNVTHTQWFKTGDGYITISMI